MKRSYRILVIDDNPSIHTDIERSLVPESIDRDELQLLEAELFGESAPQPDATGFSIDFALQGEEGCRLLERALADGNPYSVAIVDMRMPPGWDGLKTIEELWKVDGDLQKQLEAMGYVDGAITEDSAAEDKRKMKEEDDK